MKERVLTALGIVAIAALAFAMGEWGTKTLVLAFILIAGYEVYHIRKTQYAPIMAGVIMASVLIGGLIPSVYYMVFLAIFMMILFMFAIGFEWFDFNEVAYVFLMVAILTFALQSLQYVLAQHIFLFVYLLIANFATDTFAYFGGYFFGKHKLNERISPKKTIEGSLAGFIGSLLVSLAFYFAIALHVSGPTVMYFMASLLIPILSQVGDLAFSLVKRHFNVKDFGNIFPGHGGVLDRIDSLIFSLIVFYSLTLIFL